MSHSIESALEHKRLLRVAREYRQQGFVVTISPKSGDLPEALASCTFDLIAEGEEKTIAVEVRTREHLTLNGPEDLRVLTQKVQQVPGWEIELVVTNPRK
jgi:Holliday junction resolvase